MYSHVIMWPILRIFLQHIASPYQCTLLFISPKGHIWAFPRQKAAGVGLSAPIGRTNHGPIPLLSLTQKKRAASGLNLAEGGPGLSPALHSSKARVPARFHPGIKRQGQAGPLAAASTCQRPARIRLPLTEVKIKGSASAINQAKTGPVEGLRSKD